MVQVSTIKYLNAVREQFQSCWLFMFSASSHTKPQNTLEHTRNISAAEAELQEHFPKTSDRQTDRQTPRGAGLGLQPEQPGTNPFLGNHLVRAAAAPSRAVNPSSQRGWIWQETTTRVLSGAAQPRPSEEQLPLAVSNLLVQPWDCCCRLPLQAALCFGRGAGVPSAACWHVASDLSEKAQLCRSPASGSWEGQADHSVSLKHIPCPKCFLL